MESDAAVVASSARGGDWEGVAVIGSGGDGGGRVREGIIAIAIGGGGGGSTALAIGGGTADGALLMRNAAYRM